ncbi:MAG TPA: DUF1801 domain-containing protein [Actinomycetota bacterium]|nr:DUF1801 domain-containing protein [Actinomycetota bacterium]
MEDAVQAYIDAIPPEQRELFDRLHTLIRAAAPDAEVVLSYQIPTFKVGKRRLFLAAWKHGVSLYGWGEDRDGGFLSRHPELKSGRATLRLRPTDAEAIGDEEFLALATAALAP